MRTASGRRHFTFLRGLGAERLALLVLLAKGYRPLARRFSAAGGEVDLIVRRGATVAFVEVKARATLDEAATAIDEGKRRRFCRAARAWQSRHPGRPGAVFRGDAVFVAPNSWPRHLPDAFSLD